MLPSQGYSSTLVPLAARQCPRTRMLPSCTEVHAWFDLPVHVARSIAVPAVVRDDGSSRHMLLPPCCESDPVMPLSATAWTVQVNEADAVAPSASVAVTFTL